MLIENLLPTRYADEIENICRNRLQWHYLKSTSYENGKVFSDSMVFDRGQFVLPLFHSADKNTPHWFFNVVKPLIWTVQDKVGGVIGEVERVKVNLLLQQDTFPVGHYNAPHKDSDSSSYSMVYYVNDSDGDTVLFNEFDMNGALTVKERIQPQRNSVVLFESKRIHASSNPLNTPERYVINFVFHSIS